MEFESSQQFNIIVLSSYKLFISVLPICSIWFLSYLVRKHCGGLDLHIFILFLGWTPY